MFSCMLGWLNIIILLDQYIFMITKKTNFESQNVLCKWFWVFIIKFKTIFKNWVMEGGTWKSLVKKYHIIFFPEDCKIFIFFNMSKIKKKKKSYSYFCEDLLCFWFSYINDRGVGAWWWLPRNLLPTRRGSRGEGGRGRRLTKGRTDMNSDVKHGHSNRSN